MSDDQYDEENYEITDGQGFEQDGAATGGDGDFEYPLTAFVPKATVGEDSRAIPGEAATWVIPNVAAGRYYRVRRLFKLSWKENVPAPYRLLFVRTANRKPDPTNWQQALINASFSKYDDLEGGKGPKIDQVVLLPIIRLYEGEFRPMLAEVGINGYEDIKKGIDLITDTTDGNIGPATHAWRIWKDAKGNITVKPHKGATYDVQQLVAEYGVPDPNEYVSVRAMATERWWLEEHKRYRNGEASTMSGGMSREERLAQAMEHIPTTRLKTILKQAGVEVSSSSRPRLVEAALDNVDAIEASVMTVAATFEETAADKQAEQSAEVPF